MATGLVLQTASGQYAIKNHGVNIGRGMGNQINLNDSDVSRHHAAVQLRSGTAYIRDLGSKNGTRVNGARIHGEMPLHIGDQIQIGNTRLTLSMGQVADETTAIGGFVAIALVVAALVLGGIGIIVINSNRSASPRIGPPAGAVGALTSPALSTVYLATVRLGNPVGSGMLMSPSGHILTSARALAAAGIFVPEGCQQVAPELYVGLIPEEARPPEKFYRAMVYCGDPGAGLALLRVVATDGGGPLPPDLIFPALVSGDSDLVQLGSEIKLLGYAGARLPIKSVPGNIAQFQPGLKGPRTWMTANVAIDESMYGGAVIASGQLVALTTSAPNLVCVPTCLIPINAARGLLAQIR